MKNELKKIKEPINQINIDEAQVFKDEVIILIIHLIKTFLSTITQRLRIV